MSRARDLSKIGNKSTLAVDTDNIEVGIGSTVPSSTLDVRGEIKVGTAVQLGSAGVVTATSFSGSGANLTGLATTETVRADTLTVAGVSTLTGAVNVDATTDSTSVTTGALIVDGGVGIAKNVYIGAGLSVAGTLTYEDVTNVDSVGLITAKSGVNVSGGQLQVGVAYSVGAAGVCTAAGFVGPLTGAVTGNATGLTGTPNISAGTIAGSTGTFTGDVDIADKIVHTGDTNTAIRFPSVDTFTVETAGTERIRVTSTGEIKVNTGSGTEGIQFQASSGSNVNLRGVGTNYGELGFFIGNNEKLRLTSGGAVGVGTTNPQNSANFQHYTSAGRHQSFQSTDGDFAIVTDNNSAPAAYIKGTGTADLLNVYDNTSIALTIIDGGKVGIKSEIPGHPLDVYGNIRSHQSTPALYLQTTGTASGSAVIRFGDAASFQNGSIQYDYSGNQHLRFKMGGSGMNVERMVIEGSTGYVGINTTTPTTYLDVFGGSNSIEVGNQSGSGRFGADGTSTKIGSHTNHHFDIFTNSSSNRKLRITSGGGFLFDNGELVERCNITAGKLSANQDIDLADGMVHYFTTQETTTALPNIRVDGSTTLNSVMGAGDVVTVTLVTTAAAAGYSAHVTIDGNAVTEEWVGGSAPSEGGSDGLDIYVYTIICIHASNTGDSGFKVIANKVNATN